MLVSSDGVVNKSYADRLVWERDYCIARLFAPSWQRTRAANAMIRFAVSDWAPDIEEYPNDPDDLAACWICLLKAPIHMQTTMHVLLRQYESHVESKWGTQAITRARHKARSSVGHDK